MSNNDPQRTKKHQEAIANGVRAAGHTALHKMSYSGMHSMCVCVCASDDHPPLSPVALTFPGPHIRCHCCCYNHVEDSAQRFILPKQRYQYESFGNEDMPWS